MRRVIGIDLHRTSGEVVIWEDGILRHAGRVDMTRTEFAVITRATKGAARAKLPCCCRLPRSPLHLSIADSCPTLQGRLQVKAIAQAGQDRQDRRWDARQLTPGRVSATWTPDAVTESKRRLAARRYQVVRHRTRIKNEVHSILHAHLIPKCRTPVRVAGRGLPVSHHPTTSAQP